MADRDDDIDFDWLVIDSGISGGAGQLERVPPTPISFSVPLRCAVAVVELEAQH